MEISRRSFLKHTGALGALALTAGFPRLTFANLPTENRFILVILRGAMDGLAAVPPYGDKNYAAARGGLAFTAPGTLDGVIDLDGFYGLNPALAELLPLYQQRQMAIFHAVASPYRNRSHFDAQNLLETGLANAGGSEGWLNRMLQSINGGNGAAVAINQQIPLVLQGKLGVGSWTPNSREIDPASDYMTKIASMYGQDPLLAGAFEEAVKTQAMAQASLPMDDQFASGKAKDPSALYAGAKAAAMFLAKQDGPRVAVMEAGGWDTHRGQGTSKGALFTRLNGLAKGLAALPAALGSVWNKTVVVVVTEFGRTVAENGTGGTDHGTGTVAFVLGGAIQGGKVYGKWPGLAANDLFEGRDLMPKTDLRSIQKTVLYSHLGVPQAALDTTIFPASGDAAFIPGLMG